MELPASLPANGIGARGALDLFAPTVLGGASLLGERDAMVHMDPPTPGITWATPLWNAALNQNLLHPATAPVARGIENWVVGWPAPALDVDVGHMVTGSTVANLIALLAARELIGIDEVVTADFAHASFAKASNPLGLRSRPLPVGRAGALCAGSLPDDLSCAALVLTAGSTGTGAIDDLGLVGGGGMDPRRCGVGGTGAVSIISSSAGPFGVKA